VLDAVTECGGKPTIACLGLAFKPNVDDLRESPALAITKKLGLLGAGNVLAVEPHINELPADMIEANVTLADFDQAIADADIVLLLVDHAQFLKVERSALDGKMIIDTRGAW